MAGDVGEPGQERLLREAGEWLVDGVDVAVVPHHGSADQSARLAATLGPRLALVSVGADNDYGHPTEEALDLYESVGALIRRTDRCGATTVFPVPVPVPVPVPAPEPAPAATTPRAPGRLAVLDACH